MIHINRRSRLF